MPATPPPLLRDEPLGEVALLEERGDLLLGVRARGQTRWEVLRLLVPAGRVPPQTPPPTPFTTTQSHTIGLETG